MCSTTTETKRGEVVRFRHVRPSELVTVLVAWLLVASVIAGCATPDEEAANDVEEPRATRAWPTAEARETTARSSDCSDPQPAPVTDLDIREPPSLPQPPARTPTAILPLARVWCV